MAAAKPKNYDFLVKLLLIGDSGVGKSCLLLRFSDDSFTHNFIATIGIDFKVKTIDLDGRKIKLQIWDTAGQERFHTITTAYYRGANGMVLVYDVSDEKTFENVGHWIQQTELHATQGVNKMILGNKCDMPTRVVSTERGQTLAAEHKIKFFETSAKSNQNVSEAFLAITRDVVQRFVTTGGNGGGGGGGDAIRITDGDAKTDTNCCGGPKNKSDKPDKPPADNKANK